MLRSGEVLVFEAQPVFSKLSEATPLDERDRIFIATTPSMDFRMNRLQQSMLNYFI